MTRISREMRARIKRETEAQRHAPIEITPAMVERAARAWYAEKWAGDDWSHASHLVQSEYRTFARVALAAALTDGGARVRGG